MPPGCVYVFFSRAQRGEGMLEVWWVPTDENNSDLFTKNLDGATFTKHTFVYVRG